jgi:predicted nucleotidyltransferase
MRVTQSNIIDYLQEIKAEVANDGISAIGLFGSFARNDAGVYSDIDIAIQKETDYLQKRTAYDIFDLDSNSSIRDEIMKDFIESIAEQFDKLLRNGELDMLSYFEKQDIKGSYDLRNFIAHDYEGIDLYIAEDVINERLGVIKQSINKILEVSSIKKNCSFFI